MATAFRSYRTDDPEHPFTLFADGYEEQWTRVLNGACAGVAAASLANMARCTRDFLSFCRRSPSGRAVLAMTAKRGVTQTVLHAFFSQRYVLKFAGSAGGYVVSRRDGSTSDAELSIRVLTRLFAVAKAILGKFKKNPMKVGRRSREYRLAIWKRILATTKPDRGRRRMAPGDAFFRVLLPKAGKWAGPKPIPDNFRDTVERAAIEDGWPEELVLLQTLEAASGGRDMDARKRTFADWAVSDFGNEFDCDNKGSQGQRVKRLKINDKRKRRFWRYVNGVRLKRAPGKDMAYWRRVLARAKSGDPEAQRELSETPVLLGASGGRPPSYRTKARWMQRSMQRRGIAARGHAQRHEHTTERFDEIDAMPISEEAKILLLREMGRDKHWADFDMMYKVYAREAVARRWRRIEIEFQDKRDAGLLATQRREPGDVDIPEGDIIAGIPIPAIFADAFATMDP